MKRLLGTILIAAATAVSALAQSVTVTSSATTYGSVAGQFTLTVNFNFATPTSAPTAMAFEITAPAGWSYGGGYSGDIPAAKPVTGATGPLGFAFSDFDTLTPGKVAFSFKVNYDAGLSGAQTFPVTVAQYKDGVVGTVNLTVPNITFTSASGGTVTVPVISSATTASATVGAAFSYTITATNTPSSFAAAGLPAGLSLNTTTGVISGTPTTAGTSNVSLTATNAGGTSAAATLVLTVNPPPPVISSATTASATVGTAFSYQITASNNPTSYAATGLPVGLSLNATTGAISGTPTTAGTSTVSLTATNAGGTSAVVTLSLTISNAGPTSGPSVQITPSAATYTSVAGQITLSVTFNFATPTSAPTAMAFEITAPAGWSYAGGYSGDIPAAKPVTGATGPLGFAFSDFDTLTPGKVAFSFKVNYEAGLSGTQTLPVTVAQYKDGVVGTVNLTVPNITFTSAGGGTVAVPVISSATTASATVGTAFSYTITASNSPSSFAATGLPAGLSLDTTTGVISGTPTAAGSSTVSLTATNSGGTSVAVSLVLTVAKATGTVTITPSSLAQTYNGSPRAVAATTTPSDLNVIFTYQPTGGVASQAAPINAGSYAVTATIDAPNHQGSASGTLNVAKADQTITFAALPAKTVGDPAFTLSATSSSGGAVTYTSSNSAVATISGNTVTIVGSGSTNIVASQSGTSNYNAAPSVTQSLTVNPAPVAPSITTQPASVSVTAGTSASFSVSATGTPAPSFQWKKGTVDIAGATNSTYSISATASGDAGSYFVTVSNVAGSVTSNAATLTVTAPVQAPVISSATTASATVGTAFSYQIAASNSPTSYAATNLPSGLSLNATSGVISGTPTAAGTSSVSLTATNSGGTSAAVTLVITVNAAAVAPSITTQPQSQSVTAGASITFSVVATGTAPLTYQWKKGTADISGATNSSYTIPATVSADAGSYFVTVSNSAGTVTSNAASLTVTTASSFSFSQQPVAITRSRGETASFQVNATGGTGTVTYKWYKDGTALSDSFGRISGSGTQTLVISNVGVADGGSYSATATTVQNGTITSNGAALTVLGGPTITRPVLDAAVLAAGSASFSVAATGSGALIYQWYFTPAAGGTTTPLADITSKVAGATTSTLTVSSVQKPNDEGFYSCSVTDSAGTARSTGSLSVVSRVLKISAPNAVPGADVVVSVLLQANGDENAANFAIVFDPSKLTYKSFAAGAQSDSGSASVPAGTTGRLNVLVGKTPPDIWTAGSNEIARITFTSAATGGTSLVGFDDISASSPRSVSSATGQTLFAGYQGAYVSSISGLEGDIDGDGKLTAADWTAMGRIVLGLDPAPTGEKFMRADCAPRTGTGGALQLGDKLFNAADWTQVGRYVLGLDPVTNIGGPSGP